LNLLALLGLVLWLSTSAAKSITELSGTVIKVADGDTVTLKAQDTLYKIRLAEIDTAEKDQPYGLEAKKALAKLVLNKQVSVKVIKKKDRYGRVIGRLFVDQIDVNAHMIAKGHAMVYRRYLSDESLLKLESDAKENNLGVWALPEKDRVPPWTWRKQKRK
jgi:micrococcal nuclease